MAARASHDAWLKQLRVGASVQELAKRLHMEMQADDKYRSAVATEMLAMTKRWEAWAQARVLAANASLTDDCAAHADASDTLLTSAECETMAVGDAHKYRSCCVLRLQEVERQLMSQLATAAAAEVYST